MLGDLKSAVEYAKGIARRTGKSLTERPDGWTVSDPAWSAALQYNVCPVDIQRVLDHEAATVTA